MRPFIHRLSIVVLSVGSTLAGAQEPRTYAPAEMQADLQRFRVALLHGHAAFVARDTAAFAQAFDAIAREGDHPLSAVEFNALVMRLVALLDDGHTRAFPTNATRRFFGRQGLLPFHVAVQHDRVFIRRDLSDADLGVGSELLAVDGTDAAAIVRRLRTHLGVDGGVQSGFDHRLGSNYNSFYRIYPQVFGFRAGHVVTVRDVRNGSVRRLEVAVIGSAVFERRDRERYGAPLHTQSLEAELAQPALDLELVGDSGYARLRIRRFFKDGFDEPLSAYPAMLRDAFSRIAAARVGTLLVDLRSNGGGIGANAAELVRYLSDSTFTPTTSIVFRGDDAYYRRITADSLQLDGYFALRPVPTGMAVTNTDSLVELRPYAPARNPRYRGRLIVLIDGGTLSAAAQAAGLLRRYSNAIFVGRETGGYAGMSNGLRQLAVRGEHTDVGINFPLAHAEYPVEPDLGRRGVVPDHVVYDSTEDIRLGRDGVLYFVRTVLR